MDYRKIYADSLDAPLQSVEDGLPISESRKIQIYRKVCREANGQAIPTNAMTDYVKQQNLTIEQIAKNVKAKLESTEQKAKTYVFTDDETYEKDYKILYGEGITYTTPIGIQARMGENQKGKLLCHPETGESRSYLLYTIKDVFENPTVIIWKPVTDADRAKERQKDNPKHLKGKMLFAKSFIFDDGKTRLVNSVTIEVNGQRVSVSNHERHSIGTFIDKEVEQQDNRIVYVKR
jgi:hypothetical protein